MLKKIENQIKIKLHISAIEIKYILEIFILNIVLKYFRSGRQPDRLAFLFVSGIYKRIQRSMPYVRWLRHDMRPRDRETYRMSCLSLRTYAIIVV